MSMSARVSKLQELTRRMSPRSWRVLTCAACMLVLAGVLYKELHISANDLQQSDFRSYYQAALDVRGGVNPLTPVSEWIRDYRAGQPLVASYYVYTPFFALLMVPFTALPLSAAFVLWGLCGMTFLVGSIYGIYRSAGQRFTMVGTLVLTSIAALLPPVRFEFTWGQADLFVLFMLCAAIWTRQAGHPILGGIVLAMACVTKPPLLLIVGLLLWKREFKLAAVALVAVPVLLLVPFLWLGGQALSDQFAVWQFWSNVYTPFIDNMAPKGVLARLFTINPSAHPLVVAPALATLGYLVVAGIAGILTLVMTTSRPLRRDCVSMLELGLGVSALLVISPLTEYIYLTLLVFSLVGMSIKLTQVNWRSSPYRLVTIAVAGFVVVICLPLQRIEYFFWPRMYTQSALSALYIALGAPYLYVLAGYFALHLYALRLMTGRHPWDIMRASISRWRIVGMPAAARTPLGARGAALHSAAPRRLAEDRPLRRKSSTVRPD